MFDELFEMFERDGDGRSRNDRGAGRQRGIRGFFSRLFGRDDHASDDPPGYRDERHRTPSYRDDDDDGRERRYRAHHDRDDDDDDDGDGLDRRYRDDRRRDDDDERRHGRRGREREGAFSFFGDDD
jgi:hypothetical protein